MIINKIMANFTELKDFNKDFIWISELIDLNNY